MMKFALTPTPPCPPHEWAHSPTVGYFRCSKCGETVNHTDSRYAEMANQGAEEAGAIERLSRAVWDSRVMPSKADVAILLSARATDYEVLAEGYKAISGRKIHASDCATSNAPAERPGPCDCDPLDYCPGYCARGEEHSGPCALAQKGSA